MKILHVVYSCIPGNFRGGIPKIVYELSQAQAELGHEVTIYTTEFNSSVRVSVPLDGPISFGGVKIQYFTVTNHRWMQSSTMLRAMLDSTKQYDVIHGHNTFLALNRYVAKVHRMLNVPIFYHTHGALDPIMVNKGFIRRMRKLFYIYFVEKPNYAVAHRLFANTSHELRQIRHYELHTPISIVQNGVIAHSPQDYKAHAETFRNRLGISKERPIILFIGRIVPKKGIHLLIRAFAQLHSRFPNVVLVIVGDRQEEPKYVAELDQFIMEQRLIPNIFWPGFLDDLSKVGSLGAATIFSHVSESEGMAMAVLEAMAAGVPTVVSKECYMDEAVRAGALAESAFDVTSLYIQLEQLLCDSEQRCNLGQKASQYVREYHNWYNVAKQITEVYSLLD